MRSRRELRVHFSGRRPLPRGGAGSLRTLLCGLLEDHGAIGSVSIVFVTDEEIQALHRDFFDDDTPTDVVTFPLGDNETHRDSGSDSCGSDSCEDGATLGEIFVSTDTARRESVRRGRPLFSELALYAVHGVLHLLGYDDRDVASRRRMRQAERRYMKRLSDRGDA